MSEMTNEQRDSDEVGYFDVAPMVETLKSCWGLGPLDVCAKLVSDHIDITIELAGMKIASGSLTVAHNKLCAGANAGLVKVSLCVIADFPNKTVWVNGELCTRKWTGGWDCNSFKSKILSW